MFLHVSNAKYLDEYKVEISFNNGKSGIADLADIPKRKSRIFNSLKDISIFSQLHVDSDIETIVWPNGVDLAPEYLYFHVFKNDPTLQCQFREWGYIA